MQKETIVVILIFILIVIANIITQKYTMKTVHELNGKLEELRLEIDKVGKDNIDSESVKEIMKQIKENWEKHYNKLAYYIEHDELEKVKTNIVILNSDIETNDYEDSISRIEESKFILKHIQDKYAFTLENIF